MGKPTKTVITIYEGDYEFLALSDIVKEADYFDTIYEMLVEKGEVVYRDYLIKYKRRNKKNKYRYITYDENELPIRSYSCNKELANAYEVNETNFLKWFKNGNEFRHNNGDLVVRFVND